MENASKALLMAGGVLVGLLVLSLAVYLFVTFGANAKEIRDEIDSTQLTKFNANFNIYADRNDITIYNIISLVNLAKENNDYYKDNLNYKTDYVIDISLYDGGVAVKMNADKDGFPDQFTSVEKQNLIKKYSTVTTDGEIEHKFKCKSISYHSSGRIYKMEFEKN